MTAYSSSHRPWRYAREGKGVGMIYWGKKGGGKKKGTGIVLNISPHPRPPESKERKTTYDHQSPTQVSPTQVSPT